MNPISKSFQFGQHKVTLETGQIARQADGAVMIDMDGTVLMCTVVAAKSAREGQDFFPLTVDYQEKNYAAGKIPGGFFRREGRPGEKEILTCRLIDRPIRPLFPKGYKNEVQIIVTVMSLNPEVDPEIPSILGVSAALGVSGVPFSGPVGAARVGFKEGEFILNQAVTGLNDGSDLDLIVAGTSKAVLMVESEANELDEDIMLNAVLFGHEQMQVAISAIAEFVSEVDPILVDWKAPEEDKSLTDKVAEVESALGDAYLIADKMDRYDAINGIRDGLVEKLSVENSNWDFLTINGAFAKLEKQIVRGRILNGEPRIDGRSTRDVRKITVKTGVLPRTHGSALFTRGETQALVVTTLGMEKEAQIIDALEGTYRDPFILHYNFPPFSVGETGRVGTPKRREIGHGRLAKRGVLSAMPTLKSFPYTIRVVSEITESNGSSSMASVCGTSLSLMDAGVPIKAPVAGVAMGLIKGEDRFAILTDILGDEDHLGDMDFKVAGTETGINALQMDIKIDGITREIMQLALDQAKEGRLYILAEMNKVISEPRTKMSDYAPQITSFKINKDKIRDVIGKGGSTIRGICDETGATVDINDDGLVRIFATDRASGQLAKKRVEQIIVDVEVNKIYEGKVVRIMDFGAFVTILPGKDGLVHISQISEKRVEKVSDELSEGDVIQVKVLEIDKQGRIRLSMKAVNEKEEESEVKTETED